MTQTYKTRKVELIVYGYGRRSIITLKSFDLNIPRHLKQNRKFDFHCTVENAKYIEGKSLK